jgi:hypothetical protein
LAATVYNGGRSFRNSSLVQKAIKAGSRRGAENPKIKFYLSITCVVKTPVFGVFGVDLPCGVWYTIVSLEKARFSMKPSPDRINC